MKHIFKIIFLLGLNNLPVSASFNNEINKIAVEITERLNLSTSKPLYITTLPYDEECRLPLEPIYDMLEEALKSKVSQIRFTSLNGNEERIINGIGRIGIPLVTYDVAVDSLIMTGSYFIMDQLKNRINCVVKIQDIRAQKLYKSKEFSIDSVDCPPQLQREVFTPLHNEESIGMIRYRGQIIKQLEDLFNTPNNNLLVPPALYAFDKQTNYAIPYQVNALKNILSLNYGIRFLEDSTNSSSNKIIVRADGTLVFIRDGKSIELQKIIGINSIFPTNSLGQCNSYTDFFSPPGNSDELKKPYEKKIKTLQEIEIRDQIVKTFNSYYPSLFNPFNYDALNKIYYDTKKPSILMGKRISSNPNTGKEEVEYTWMTKKIWLDHFKHLHDTDNCTFDVHTQVLKIFKDDRNCDRYWAIVRQNWKTKDILGVTGYQDDGFLFVYFDFIADQVLKDFKIYYRLWFYEYQFDETERHIKRYEKLERDITEHFKNGVSGVSVNLKNTMCSYLVGTIRKNGNGVGIRSK